MSKDIRSFFNVISKKSGTSQPTKSPATSKKPKPTVILDSDDEDVIPPTPKQKTSKKQLMIVSDSDDEDASKTKPTKTQKRTASTSPKKIAKKTKIASPEKVKPISIADVFQSTPVKQSAVKTTPKKPPVVEEPKQSNSKKSKKETSKKHKTSEAKVHNDSLFEQTLMDLDDGLDEAMLDAFEQCEQANEQQEKENGSTHNKKRERESIGDKNSEKRQKLEHTDSGIGGHEVKEKKNRDIMAYQKYLNRSGPRLHGLKEPPKGTPTALQNLCFVRTGVLDSLEQDEFEQIIKSHGGRTVSAVSRKVNYLVVGDEPGESKLAKAENFKITKISEDELFDLILTKSGLEPKYVKKAQSEDQGIETEEFDTEISDNNHTTETTIKLEPQTPQKNQKVLEVKEEKKTPKEQKEVKPLPQVEKVKTEENISAVPLWQKYKPKDLKDIIGQHYNVERLKKWLQNWYRNQLPEVKKTIPRPSPWAKNDNGAYYKAALLSGAPGVGKTTTATLVAQNLNLDIVEFNASDTRNKRLLHDQVSQLLSSKTLSGFAHGHNNYNLRVLIMDEVDGMSGNEDRGGVQELIQLIKDTKVPIICICNNRNHQKMRSLVNYCFDLTFNKPSIEQIMASFKRICIQEGINISQEALKEIITGTGCDVRQSLSHLSMYALSKDEVSEADAKKTAAAGKKDIVLGPWEVVRAVFSESEQKNMNLHEKFALFFYDYSLNPLFVQENYLAIEPKGCNKIQALKKAALTAQCLSLGDYMDAQMRKSNDWALLPAQALFSSVLPGFYMSGTIKGKINFPSWLGNNSKKNKFSRLASEIQTHTRTTINSSKSAIILDYLSPLRDIIFAPVLQKGNDGVRETVDLMKTYNLRREDLDGLTELTEWRAKKNLMDMINSKVKSALTRLYNKEVSVLPYSLTSKKKKATDDLYEEEENGEEDEEDDDLANNPMIKMKTSTKNAKGKKADAGASTSKKAEPKKRAPAKKK